MSNILITGATGNVGFQVIRYLIYSETGNRIIAGVRNIERAKKQLSELPGLEFREFDFENPKTYDMAFTNIDRVFLLRPPHISDVNSIFLPIINSMRNNDVMQIVFLSVQGVQKSKFIPHYKVEKLIIENNLDYVFLRPSYYMQNLTTTLLTDIKTKREILLPAGKAKFNWIDANNIGKVAALILEHFPRYKNKKYELTGYENLNFYRVAEMISKAINAPVSFQNVSPIRFYFIKRRERMNRAMIIVMFMLHFLPRFQNQPRITDTFEKLTGNKPTNLKDFLSREKSVLSDN